MPRQRGQIQARGEGKWLVRLYVGLREDGSRGYSSRIVKGTEEDAKVELARMLRQMAAGKLKAGKRVKRARKPVPEHDPGPGVFSSPETAARRDAFWAGLWNMVQNPKQDGDE